MFDYPVEFTPDDNGTVMATFPDVPEAVTFGEDEADALARAADAIEIALAAYISDRRDIPAASPANGRPVVELPLLAAMKLQLYRHMRSRDMRKADLARAMHVNPRQVDRLLDLAHSTPVPQIEAAAQAIGSRIMVEMHAI